MMNIHDFILHLSLIDNVGPALINRILEKIPHDTLAEVYNFSVTDLMHRCGIAEKSAHLIVEDCLIVQSLIKN